MMRTDTPPAFTGHARHARATRVQDELVRADLAAFIADRAFPCVGAKSALSHDAIITLRAGDLRCADHDARIVARLQDFAQTACDDAVFVSVAVVFDGTPRLSELAFEAALWRRLQALHDIDARRHDWDPSVSRDPRARDFSMSLGGRAFYVIGLHPGAGRAARRFGHAALVFNLHSQFERLRADGRYTKLHATIGERDVALCGSRNPMLAAHGERSEAPQYSGRVVDAGWTCPFSARPSHAHDDRARGRVRR